MGASPEDDHVPDQVRWLSARYVEIDRKFTLEQPALCRTAQDGSLCLLGITGRTRWTCSVCASILRWQALGYSHVVVRERDGGNAAEVLPVSRGDVATLGTCIVQLDLSQDGHEDIRRVINILLSGRHETWMYDVDAQGSNFVKLDRAV